MSVNVVNVAVGACWAAVLLVSPNGKIYITTTCGTLKMVQKWKKKKTQNSQSETAVVLQNMPFADVRGQRSVQADWPALIER